MGRNLTNLYISSSYQFLTQVSGSELQDGLGNKITGSLDITASLATSASFATLATSASYANAAGTAGTATNATSASVAISSSYALSASYALTTAPITTIFETVRAGENLVKTDPVYLSGSQGANPIAYKADAGDPAKMPVAYIMNEDVTSGNTGLAIALGLIEGINLTGYTAGQDVYVAVGGGWTATRPTGSAIIQPLGIVTKGGNGGKGVVLNPGPVTLPNLTAGYAWVGNANGVPTAVATSSFVSTTDTGSLMKTGSVNLNTLTFTKGDGSTFNLTVDTGSAVTTNTGSLLVTASISNATTTFTKGDGSTFSITANNVVNADSASVATTATSASYATTALSASQASNANTAVTASYVLNAVSSSYSTTALSSSYAATATSSSVAINATSASYATNANSAATATSASYATNATSASFASAIPNNLNITASNILVTNNLTVNGTASFAYTKTTTGSAVIIGDEFIILNADTPAAPYAGIQVYDTGSASTASFEWNGIGDYWITVEENGASAMILTGISGSKGSEVAPALNKLLKGQGNNTVADSNITDNGTIVSIAIPVDVTGSINQLSGSFSGSVINNITDVYSTTAKINHVVSLTQAEYTAISASANPNTLYYITDAASFVTSASYADFALSASYATTALSSSYSNTALSASYALSASHAPTSVSASYALSSSYATFALGAGAANSATSASQAISSSYADTASSSSYALNATSASYATTALSSSYALNSTTASYALNANPAFPFTGSAGILGALNVNMTGSRVGTVTSGSFTGSFVTNVVPSASITQSQIEKIVTLNAATYASLSGSGQTADNTLYIISDTSASVAFNTVFSGSVRGEVRALSIASNTASLDLSTGNFFTLTLVSGSNTYINPSNILPGQTVNLRITQANPGNGTVSFPSSVKQVSGSVYVPTTGSGPVDIVTFASFDSTNLYLSNVKNLI